MTEDNNGLLILVDIVPQIWSNEIFEIFSVKGLFAIYL